MITKNESTNQQLPYYVDFPGGTQMNGWQSPEKILS
jgi:hypothetical protein